jgi:hypothetical protein
MYLALEPPNVQVNLFDMFYKKFFPLEKSAALFATDFLLQASSFWFSTSVVLLKQNKFFLFLTNKLQWNPVNVITYNALIRFL